MEELAPGIWRWTAPHPEYRPTVEEVVSYALVAGEALLLIDPLVPAAEDPRRESLLAGLDRLARPAGRLDIAITIPYHTRSAAELWRRYETRLPCAVWGHAGARKRLPRVPLREIPMGAAGTAAPIAGGGAMAWTIGKPRRGEHPLHVPSVHAVAFGDAVVGTRDGPRFWIQSGSGDADWYRDVFAHTLAPIADLDIRHVLVTHGLPTIGDGRRALVECLAAPPVTMY